MAFPAFDKTWTTSFNNAVATAASATLTAQKVMKQVKDCFVSAGWTIVNHSNAGIISGVKYGGLLGKNAACANPEGHTSVVPPQVFPHWDDTIHGSTDKWTVAGAVLTQDGAASPGPHISVANDLNYGVVGTRHSWMVLANTSLATAYQVCFDLSGAGPGITVVVSPGGLFTGGTMTDRPTATDEKVVSTTFLNRTATNVARKVHLWYSSDHQCTRIMICFGGLVEGFLAFDKAQNPVTGWTNPATCMCLYNQAGSANTFAVMAAATTINMVGNSLGTGAAATSFQGSTTFEAYATNTALPTAAGIGTAVNAFNSAWPVMAMGIASSSGRNTGRLGNIFDMWHSPSGVTDADTFANTGGNGVVKLGGQILPWDGSTAVALT